MNKVPQAIHAQIFIYKKIFQLIRSIIVISKVISYYKYKIHDDRMAQKKGLVSPTKDLSFNSMYAAFGNVPESRILSPEVIGLTDDAVIQLRQATYGVTTGALTIDDAVASYGTFTK